MREEGGKIIPEVSDVWEFGGFLYHVIDINGKEIVFVCAEGNFMETYYDSVEDFVNRSTYLGKSKASIKDLFEVE